MNNPEFRPDNAARGYHAFREFIELHEITEFISLLEIIEFIELTGLLEIIDKISKGVYPPMGWGFEEVRTTIHETCPI